MTRYVDTHAIERSIRHLSRGPLALDRRRAAAGYDQLQEIEQQIQVPLSGTASSGVGWTTHQLAFDVQFVFAPEQRDSPLAVPHFTFGAVVSGAPPIGQAVDPNNPDSLVAVFCQVVEWARDKASDAVIGALIGLGVSVIGGADVDFDGYAHLSFQGYGAPVEDVPSALDPTAAEAPPYA